MRASWWALLMAALGATVGLAGCGGALSAVDGDPSAAVLPPANPAGTSLPTLNNLSVTPTTFRFTGGQVSFTVDVEGQGGVRLVWAHITAGSGTPTLVALTPDGGTQFAGTWTAPPNPVIGGPALTFVMRINVLDYTNHLAVSDPVVVTVDPPGGAGDAPGQPGSPSGEPATPPPGPEGLPAEFMGGLAG